MKEIKYSLLTSDEEIIKDSDMIDELLKLGRKVIFFADETTCNSFANKYLKYKKAMLLQPYAVSETVPKVTLIDGELIVGKESELDLIADKASTFNLEQYRTEHAPIDENIIVEASAGTGKTTVMIDRIMFLFHMVPDLVPEDIGMITFTNESTQTMKHKIQKRLMELFATTGLPKYVYLLENSAGLRIQTIDSFSNAFISEFGSSVGYGSGVAIRGLKYEKDNLIRDILDEMFANEHGKVEDKFGLNLVDLKRLIGDFWTKLNQAGLSDSEIACLDWGHPYDGESKTLHTTVSEIYKEVCERYTDLRKELDAIAVDDIVKELDRIISEGNNLITKSHRLKFLFVDEFQDSDNSQIRSIAWMQKAMNLNLFVVGDIKQSIYRFRGAVDTAFDLLKGSLDHYKNEVLVDNYRTSADILNGIQPLFTRWGASGLFRYNEAMSPQKHFPGVVHANSVIKQNRVIESEFIKVAKECLSDCEKYTIEHPELKGEKSQKVMVLTRTNWELKKVQEWCEEQQIPCYLRKEGTFYTSQAVLDFFALVKALAFPKEARHLMDVALSPYYGCEIDITKMQELGAGSAEQVAYLTGLLDEHAWNETLKQCRLKPILAVLNSLVTELKPLDGYLRERKAVLSSNGLGKWTESELNEQLNADAIQYIANLDELLTKLRAHFSGQMADVYGIYNYLKLNIATNRNEDEPDVSEKIGYKLIHGLTVHKSKGLEFDTVILPFTYRPYRKDNMTEILIDTSVKPTRVGWSWVEWADQYNTEVEKQKKNNYYEVCVTREFKAMDEEEARILYVALTRSIRRLEYFITDPQDHNWAGLLR